jgi:hypothetical protein
VDHLVGDKEDGSDVIGVYPLLSDGTCRFIVFDFDNHEKGAQENDYANTDSEWQDEVHTYGFSSKNQYQLHLPEILYFVFLLLDKGSASINLKSFHYYDRMYPSQDVASSIGNLIALPLQGQALRYGNIHMGAEFSGLSRQDVYEIPVESIRELLLNAAIHRSYLEHSNIQVAIYDDRLEVTSPGKLPLGQNIKRMKEGYSIIRNEAIAYAFSYMKLMEHWGSGIPRIIDRVMAAGLREPEFIDGDVDLRINIYRKQNDTNGDNVTKDVTKDVTIETNEAKVIDLIISNPTITQTKLAEELDVTTRTVKRILSKLQADGIVLREGSNRNGKWITKRKA